MIKKITLFAAAGLFLAACNDAPKETVETRDTQEVEEVVEAVAADVNVEASTIKWVGFNTYSDGRHNGQIDVKSGSFKLMGEEVVGGEFTIDMNTIKCLDLEDEEYNGKLVGHLMSEDFFDVANNPEATFVITKVSEATGEDAKGSHVVEGNLTMRGQTNNITIPANITVNNGAVSVSTPEFAIDRKLWNVMFRSSGIEGVAKDKLIDDNILLEMEING